MLSARQRQEREIATIREKNIKVKLSEADCERVAELCGRHGLTVGELFENFVGDLVGGTYSNGSDEEDLAEAWFDRCGFGRYMEETLLNYLLEEESYTNVEEFLDLIDNIEEGKRDLENYRRKPEDYDEEEIGFLKEDIVDWEKEYNEIISEFQKMNSKADIDKEIEGVRTWFKESKALKNE